MMTRSNRTTTAPTPAAAIAAVALFALMMAPTASAQSGLAILQSTAVMDLSWDSTNSASEGTLLTLPQVYVLEEETASYLTKALQDEHEPLGVNQKVLTCSVAARDQKISEIDPKRRSLDAVVTCIHAAPDQGDGDDREGGGSGGSNNNNNSGSGGENEIAVVDLDTALMQIVNPMDLPLLNPKLSFRPLDDTAVLEAFEINTRTVADVSLIVSTAVLSAMLLVLSSILLYINGGWAMCWTRCTNCLFEEIEEDDDDVDYIDNKETFNSMYETEEEPVDDDGVSLETGLQTAPSGILGAQQDENNMYVIDDRDLDQSTVGSNQAAGLGIHTPGGYYQQHGSMVDDNGTPMSEATSQRPLGIAGMPSHMKQQANNNADTPDTGANGGNDDDQKGGLAHMIMERLAQYGGGGATTTTAAAGQQ